MILCILFLILYFFLFVHHFIKLFDRVNKCTDTTTTKATRKLISPSSSSAKTFLFFLKILFARRWQSNNWQFNGIIGTKKQTVMSACYVCVCVWTLLMKWEVKLGKTVHHVANIRNIFWVKNWKKKLKTIKRKWI